MSVLDPAGLDLTAVGRATCATYVENGETLTVGDRDLLRLRAFTAAYLAALPVPSDTENPSDRNVARMFHEAYERLAPEFGYRTREASAVPWEKVPARNRDLMAATVGEIRAALFAAGRAAAHAPDGVNPYTVEPHTDPVSADIWREGWAAAASLPDGVLAFVNWFAEGPCGCDGYPDDPCDSCRALALLKELDGTAAAHPDPPDDDDPADEEFTEAAWGLIANAYGGNWNDAPDEWRGAACRWRDEYTAGATARIPAASPDPPDDWTAAILTLRRAMCTPAGREQVERELIRPFAASPDERLREALALVYVMLTGAEPMWAEMPLDERCARAANEAQQAFLAADREATDEETT